MFPHITFIIAIVVLLFCGTNSLGDFKNPEKSQGPQHTDAKRSSWFDDVPDHLEDAPHNHLENIRRHRNAMETTGIPWNQQLLFIVKPSLTHPKVKAVEGGVEVVSGPEAVHLQSHLSQEQTQEDKLGCVCEREAQVSKTSHLPPELPHRFPFADSQRALVSHSGWS